MINTKKIEWEGISYIGIVNLFVSVFLLITTFKSLRFLKLTNNRDTFYFVISILILSVLLLIYSFGIPFIFGLESIINYLGPLRQLRAIGRFAWLFYYTISIITVLLLNHMFEIKINKYFKIIIFTGAVLISSFEAYSTNKVLGDWFNHEIYSLADIKNETSENAWISKINISDYQAIIPIPYFNIGSENFIVKNNDKIAEITFVASLKTGLPTTAVMMGRTSINQTIEQLQFMNKPSTIPTLLNKVNKSKAFLIISPKNKPITNTFEQSMLDNALLIDSSGSYCYYKLTYSGYLSLLENYKHDYKLENDKNTETKHEFYYFNGFDTFKNNTPYYGRSSKKISFSTDGLIDNFTFPSIETDSAYEISFWYSNIAHDLVARSYLCVYIYDKQGSTLEYSFYCLGDYTSQFDGNWGRFSLKLKNKKTPNFVSLSLSNADDLKGDILVDNLLIKKASGIIFCHDRKEMIDNCLIKL